MASFTDAIREFQSGSLSHKEFFAQINRVLATHRANSSRYLEILREENSKAPLPSAVYAEVRQRIENQLALEQRSDGDETRMQTSPIHHDVSSSGDEKPLVDPERIKGVGDTLNGRFLLKECLGFGGMGAVYKALDLRKVEASDRNPYIAIKVLNVQFRGHPKSLIALQREAKKAQTLAHPNIVTVYDFDRDGSIVYLTMEYLSGTPLSQILRTPGFKGIPFAKALPIVRGMANALAHAHERGFVHCDFKPANVFLTDTGQVKVIDFGITRAFQRSEEENDATIFDPGSLGGLTPAYASPEMLERREPDPRDDIYALACITYELLTGQHPFGRMPATEARSARVRPQRPRNLPLSSWRALKAALSFERRTRTPTVQRFLQDLTARRRTAVIALGVSGLLVAALAIAILGYLGKPQEQTAPVERPAMDTQPSTPALTFASIAPILDDAPCAALSASVQDHSVQVEGYISERFGAARIKEELSRVPGVNSVNANVRQVSDEKCNVIELFAPYWVRTRQAGDVASIATRSPLNELKEGDSLLVDIKTPGYVSYVYIDYYAMDGGVVHMTPNPRFPGNQAPPNYAATIGDLRGWVISPPFGTDLIVLIASPTPLFDGVRPEFESAAEYLAALRTQLAKVAEKHGQEKIAVDFVQITTKARER